MIKNNRARPSILVLDDEPQVLNALEDCLEDEFEVHVETSPVEALQLVDRMPGLSVIVSDQRMPGMTGDEFFSRARQRSDATRVMITGFADIEGVIRAVNQGNIFGYVSKPWNPDQLKIAITKAAEFHRLQSELQTEQTYLHNLMENSPDAIWFQDLDQRFLRVSRTQCAWLGVDEPDDAVGLSVLVNFPPPEAAEVIEENARVVSTGEPLLDKIRAFVLPDGSMRWVSTTKAPIRNRRGEIAGLLAIKRDVTDRTIAELALAQERELLAERVEQRTRDLSAANSQLEQAMADAEQANRAKSAFLAAMSHEIRTPMNGVIGMVEILAHSPLAAEQADTVKTIRDSAFGLLAIVDDILDFSKIEAGRLTLEQASVPLLELVEGVADSLAPLALRSNVDLRLFVGTNVPEEVCGDSVRLRQILNNLLGNAIKFSGERHDRPGLVRVRVSWQDAPQELEIRVIDNGIGMAEATVANLFSPFVQAEISTTRRFGGTGLGLAICKRLVELMQGKIEVASVRDEGSEFTVRLPLERIVGEKHRPLADVGGIECILIAGPNFDIDDFAMYLIHGGAVVHRAASNSAAVRLAAAVGLSTAVVIRSAGQTTSDAEMSIATDELPPMRTVIVSRGRRRSAQIATPDVVTLDGSPLHRADLLRAVAVAAGRASPELVARTVETVSRLRPSAPDIAKARANGKLILVAEDDQVNQKVILRQLALLGYASDMATNGDEALRFWREGSYALLLTDLHMPDLDGYALCQTIRSEEAGGSRMPIIALTANALRGESVRARAVGMDDYLTKPIPLETLGAILARWIPEPPSEEIPPIPSATAHRGPASTVDVAVLTRLIGDDPVAVRDLLIDFRQSAGAFALQLQSAASSSDLVQVGAIAHKLKSSARTVGALGLGDLCAELENASKAADRSAVKHRLVLFASLLDEVDADIEAYLTA